MSCPSASHDKWMVLALSELRRLLGELEPLPWPPPDWARFRFDYALQAAEDGRFRDAYHAALWSPQTARQRLEEMRPVAGLVPSIAEYRERLDIIPVLPRKPPALH